MSEKEKHLLVSEVCDSQHEFSRWFRLTLLWRRVTPPQQVNILREFRHPHIVRYYDRIIDKGRTKIYIVMEYCAGGDLAAYIKKCRREKRRIEEDVIWKATLDPARAPVPLSASACRKGASTHCVRAGTFRVCATLSPTSYPGRAVHAGLPPDGARPPGVPPPQGGDHPPPGPQAGECLPRRREQRQARRLWPRPHARQRLPLRQDTRRNPVLHVTGAGDASGDGGERGCLCVRGGNGMLLCGQP